MPRAADRAHRCAHHSHPHTAHCAAFLGATRSMRSGDRASFNRFLRFRVLAQGITVVGCVAGAWWLGREARLGKMQQETEGARTGRRPLREGKFDGGLDGRIKEAERLSAVERASDQAQKEAPPAVEPGKAEQKRNDLIQPIKVSTLLGARVEKRPPPPADGPSASKT